MDFEYFYNKQRKLAPTEPIYWSLCRVLQGSGEDREITDKIFFSKMVVGKDYDKKDEEQMLNYLFIQSKDTL